MDIVKKGAENQQQKQKAKQRKSKIRIYTNRSHGTEGQCHKRIGSPFLRLILLGDCPHGMLSHVDFRQERSKILIQIKSGKLPELYTSTSQVERLGIDVPKHLDTYPYINTNINIYIYITKVIKYLQHI